MRCTKAGARAVLAAALFAVSIPAETVNEDVLSALRGTLQGFAEKHSLSGAELQRLLGEVVFNDPLLRKGGVGALWMPGVYVLLDDDVNTVRTPSGDWRGAAASQREIAIVIDGQVAASFPLKAAANISVISFEPTSVSVIDLNQQRGGRYDRRPK